MLGFSISYVFRAILKSNMKHQELQKLLSEERMAKEQLTEEIHALRSRALSEESARGSRTAQEVRPPYGIFIVYH